MWWRSFRLWRFSAEVSAAKEKLNAKGLLQTPARRARACRPPPRQKDMQKLKAILGSDQHRKMASAALARAGLQLHVDGLVGRDRPPCNMKYQALSLAHYLRRTDWSRFGRTLHHRLGPVRLFPCPRYILSAFGADLRHRSKP